MYNLDSIVDQLLTIRKKLTVWETRFANGIDYQRRNNADWEPSVKQVDMINHIYSQRVRHPSKRRAIQ